MVVAATLGSGTERPRLRVAVMLLSAFAANPSLGCKDDESVPAPQAGKVTEGMRALAEEQCGEELVERTITASHIDADLAPDTKERVGNRPLGQIICEAEYFSITYDAETEELLNLYVPGRTRPKLQMWLGELEQGGLEPTLIAFARKALAGKIKKRSAFAEDYSTDHRGVALTVTPKNPSALVPSSSWGLHASVLR